MTTALQAALARLDARVDWERLDRSRMQVGLAPVRALLHRLGDPQSALRVVHVAGSKGKGSVCALVAAGLRHAGLRAGCYLSPHVDSLHERVLIDGRPIAGAALARSLHAALDAAEGDGGAATRFDLLTAAALHALRAAGVAWAVVEVGLGGRDDSTNVVQPEVAVITTIGLEHTEVLGPTVAEIAVHKAGIVKPGCTLVTAIGPGHDAWPALAAALQRSGAQLHAVPERNGDGIDGRNRALARAVLDALGRRGVQRARAPRRALCGEDLDEATADAARLPGRLERAALPAAQGGGVLPLVIDGAHTDFALRQVLDDLARDPALPGPPVLLFALAADKPAARLLDVLPGRVRTLLALPLGDGRTGWPAAQLVAEALRRGVPAEPAADAGAALRRAAQLADGGWVLAAGSLQLAGQVRRALRTSRPRVS
ncbi:MAG: Mur ligase family protein [Rubrivivax sp.]